MQISDLVYQYQQNLASGNEVSTGTKGIEQLVSTVRQMTAGHMFEGTVNSIKGNQVILGLSSGQNITARLDKGVSLEKGQSMFFQVKSNDGQQIQIRPVSFGSMNNPTLISALDAANLPVTEKHLNMVNSMMKEQMPIDTKSLSDMSRILASNPNADASSLVEMTKLDIPTTPEFISQFENYKENQGILLDHMTEITGEIDKLLTSEELPVKDVISLNQQFTEVLCKSDSAAFDAENIEAAGKQVKTEDVLAGVESETLLTQDSSIDSQKNMVNDLFSKAMMNIKAEVLPKENYPVNTIGNTILPEEYQELNQNLKGIMENHQEVLQNVLDNKGNINLKMNVSDFLNEVSEFLTKIDHPSKEEITKLFGNKGFSSMLKNVLEANLSLRPEDIASKENVDELYQKIQREINELQAVAAKAGKAGDGVLQATSEMKNNVEFMNFVNQTYSFVQIPVKFSHQNANSELYVYSNKKGSTLENEELTAFLHFDMEHLGSTDISIKMLQKNVDTQFYMDNDEAYELIANNIHILQAKIEAKGYTCQIHVNNENKQINFVEDFLMKNMKTSGPLHRYSFDVRA